MFCPPPITSINLVQGVLGISERQHLRFHCTRQGSAYCGNATPKSKIIDPVRMVSISELIVGPSPEGLCHHAMSRRAVILALPFLIGLLTLFQSGVAKVHYEEGYSVDTILKGNPVGVFVHSITSHPSGSWVALDTTHSQVLLISSPLSQDSEIQVVAGTGEHGYSDGDASSATFDHPKSVVADDVGNIYVDDSQNYGAIRKISAGRVTTIAGGDQYGFLDGPGEDARLSSDIELSIDRVTCALTVVDRGNNAIRAFSLDSNCCKQEPSNDSPSGGSSGGLLSEWSIVCLTIVVVTGCGAVCYKSFVSKYRGLDGAGPPPSSGMLSNAMTHVQNFYLALGMGRKEPHEVPREQARLLGDEADRPPFSQQPDLISMENDYDPSPPVDDSFYQYNGPVSKGRLPGGEGGNAGSWASRALIAPGDMAPHVRTVALDGGEIQAADESPYLISLVGSAGRLAGAEGANAGSRASRALIAPEDIAPHPRAVALDLGEIQGADESPILICLDRQVQ